MRSKSYSLRSPAYVLGGGISTDSSSVSTESYTPAHVSSYSKATAPSYADLTAQALSVAASNEPRNQKVLVCYLPITSDIGTISCTLEKGVDKLVFTTDHRKATIPANSIIDSIEFFGLDGFSTKDVFSIALGQLNSDVNAFPLVVDTDCSIANERMGGCRDFVSCASDGKNNRNIVIYDSIVNVDLQAPVIQGGLQIVIKYHSKLV